MFRLLLVVLCLLHSSLVLAEQRLTRIGYAHDLDNNELLYTEHHYEVFSGDTVVESEVIYKDSSGETFAQKRVNFRTNPFLPEFDLKNSRSGHQETTQFLNDKYLVKFVKNAGNSLEEKLIGFETNEIADAGFDNFVISHWQEIITGTRYTKKFLIPGLLRFFRFRIYQQEVLEQKGSQLRVLHIEPANFFIRAIAGKSKLFYDFHAPELVRFEGISNMRDDKGHNYKAWIRYENTVSALNQQN